MRLQHLHLTGFRNFKDLELAPADGFNVLWGDNAQGKTNLLEAVYFLAHLRSFRGAPATDLIGYQADCARIRADLRVARTRHRLEAGLSPSARLLRVDAQKSSAADFLGRFKTVLFAPEEVGLIKGPPAGRRSLLDRAVFLSDSGFLPRTQEYFRYLRQRNQLLREGRGRGELEPWTEGLIRTGARLRRDRLAYLGRIEKRLSAAYRRMTGGREEAGLIYRPDLSGVEDLETGLRRELERNREREVRLGQTAAGPHRDDLLFLVDGQGLRFHGSQGQQRSFLISLKVAQAEELEERTGEPPVLLLDDLTSELDRNRQGSLYEFLSSRTGQIFLTTTDPDSFRKSGKVTARLLRVREGHLEES